MTPLPAIRPERLLDRLAAFAAIGRTAKGGVDRQALTEGDRAARALLARLARARGFALFQDAAANLFVRREGADSGLPPLLVGSHLDTQPTGGRFDGALGTLAAFELLEALEDAGLATPRAVELVAWTNEEGSRFSPGCLGSQAFAAGRLAPEWLEARAPDGARLGEELAATLAALPEVAMRPLGTPVAAYLELHIEQGPVLEREDVPIGAVSAIQGTRWLEVTMEGAAAHAGTTPLAFRRDPMVAAVAALHHLQTRVMPEDPAARLTVGRIRAEPGSINAVPERVSFSVDIRHPDAGRLAAIEAEVRDVCTASATAQDCTARVAVRFDMAPLAFAEEMIRAVETAAAKAGLASRRLVSGAFHDALFLARVAPAGMIFVPCRDGVSHNEAEDVEPRFSAAGATVLLGGALELLGLAG
ncbi:Zn-dependent hydrolase [Aureimonas endophytica]|uniref:Zn-dependent hydrolase n=1 Tax=Aureimonas endophytica TaxID=2027858 RepID=A0A916ZTT1_9HYPH|nr:Zn-dependent hydrolase [Aureimonas endophytica]GGE13870.1 Zn-dependent hydrolase [Aureimonas endophytica]